MLYFTKKNKEGRMRFSLIDTNNVIITIIDANSYMEAKGHKDYNSAMILIPSEEHHVKGLDLNTYKPLTTKEKINKGLLKLEPNQVFDSKSDCVITLGEDQEYKNGEVVTLTYLEQYKKGLITEEELVSKVNAERQIAYEENTDTAVIELMRSYLNNNKDKLTKEEKSMLDEINKKVNLIKKENPKEDTKKQSSK